MSMPVDSYFYFISSPMHLMLSVNMAIQNRGVRNVAVVTTFIASNARLMSDVIKQDGQVFTDVVSFHDRDDHSKTRQRKQRMKALSAYLRRYPAARMYTGTDRNVEFQYAMHLARRRDPAVEGIYLDEGTHTYLGNKRMHRFQHKYGDALLKKLAYGLWWKSPVIIGTSAWIDTVYAVFPALVHPLYKHKKVLPVDVQYFDHPAFQRFSRLLIDSVEIDRSRLSAVDFAVLLTHDSHYENAEDHIDNMMRVLRRHCPLERIAIKAHPRSQLLAKLQARYPQALHLDNRVGFELLLPLFEEHCVFIGDVTSALFTIKWFKPDRRVIAIEVAQPGIAHFAEPLQQLFNSVNIRQLTYRQLDVELSEVHRQATSAPCACDATAESLTGR